MKFKAAILVECKKDLVIDEISNFTLKEGQVLVKINKTGICRSQIFEIDGERGEDKWLPHLLGHEAIGEVLEIGESVKKVKMGDNVILSWIQSEGISAVPAKYTWGNKIVNGGQVTTFSELSVCSENRVVPFYDDFVEIIGPSLGCAIPTGYGISLTESKVIDAKYIGVLGLGGIGMSALLGVIKHSKAKTIGIDILQERLKEASSIGADILVNSRDLDLEDHIRKITNGNMLDILIECSGSIFALNQALSLVNNSGLVKFATHPKHGDMLTLNPLELIKGKRIEGSWGGGIKPDFHIPVLAKEINDQMIFIETMNQRGYTLNNINVAINDMKQGKILRPIVDFNLED